MIRGRSVRGGEVNGALVTFKSTRTKKQRFVRSKAPRFSTKLGFLILLGGDVRGLAVIGGDVIGGRSGIGEELTGALVTFKRTIKSKIATANCEMITSLSVGAQYNIVCALARSYQVGLSVEMLSRADW